MTDVSGWLRRTDGECYIPERDLDDYEFDETSAAGLYFESGEHCQVLIKNTTTGELVELPDDGMVFVVLDRLAARDLRDAMLNPDEYPESL